MINNDTGESVRRCRLIMDTRVYTSDCARDSNISERSAGIGRVPAHAGTVTLLNITFNLFAQTSQLAARINLGSPQVWDTETKRERKES